MARVLHCRLHLSGSHGNLKLKLGVFDVSIELKDRALTELEA